MSDVRPQPAPKAKRVVVAAGAGVACAAAIIAICGPLISQQEGMILATYADPIGILTACKGHTGPELRRGQRFTKAECGAIFDKDQTKAIAAIGRCIKVTVPVESYAALTSFAFNVGPGPVCKNFAPQINRGDLKGACARLSRYVYAGGRPLRGLVIRRARERAVCERGLI